MRRYETVLCREERIVSCYRLGGYDIEAGGIDFAGIEGVGKILLDDQGATRVVQKNDAVFHSGDIFLVDDSLRGGEERAVQGNDIRSDKKIVKTDIAGDQLAFFVLDFVKRDNIHAKRFGDSSRGLPDAAKTDDAHGFAGKLDERVIPETPVDIIFPSALMYRLVVVSDTVAYFQKQGDGELSDRISPLRWNVRYGNSFLFRSGDIHDVVTRG